MKNSTKTLLFSVAAIVVLGSAAAFLLVKELTPFFWISYFFALIAVCAVGYGAWRTSQDTNQPSSYLFSTVSVIYLVCVFLAIFYCAKIPNFSDRWYAAIHVLLLAAFITVQLVSNSGHKYITEQGKEVRQQVIKARMDVERVVQMIEASDDLPEESKASVQKALSAVEDKLRYSYPAQSEETAAQAQEVEAALDALEETLDMLMAKKCDSADLELKAKAAIRKIDAYNRAKKMYK